MMQTDLIETARRLVACRKGILALDESPATMDRRLGAVGIAPTAATRRAWRDLVITTGDLHENISGVILADETIDQSADDGTPLIAVLNDRNILPGIKVDTGAWPLALHGGETVTEGLDGLRDRLHRFAMLGARFAKWRAVFAMGPGLPSVAAIDANAHALARFAALAQGCGLVPIVEPELIMAGAHPLAECQSASEAILCGVFDALRVPGGWP